jgi:hypothetical protein
MARSTLSFQTRSTHRSLNIPRNKFLRQLGLSLLWFGFVAYIGWFAPPIQSDTFQPLQTLLSGQLPIVNPVHVSLFSMVGIWLLIYSCLIFADGRMQRVRAWIFMLLSVGSGVLGLIPYLALRDPNSDFSGEKDGWLRFCDARSTGILLSISTITLFLFALVLGDWSAYFHEWQTNKFIHGMSLAFCLFALLFPALLGDDMERRGLSDARLFWAVALAPIVGPLVYLCLRPALPDS